MNVLVSVIGNIGTTILNLLVQYKSDLGISKIYGNKHTINAWNEVELNHLRNLGVLICCPKKQKGFEELKK